ncbi:DUF3151 domain-containing protein [Arthrobacter roseus]|uniref:DUF3151 domain-containing protein n=1 Tax=Arthrobacter roseus TaxID=136274 RepID=UPI001966A619|nr:DUF3151 domain-containing protein [Arthrobacter roseus]MBM7847393.1 hypothetical protein [Arthrobacter roseus]
MTENFRKNLMEPDATYLPEEPDVVSRLEAGDEALDLAAKFPASSLVWGILAEEAYAEGRVVESYAFARTGYHRGLDSLRGSGWRGTGPVPYSHEPNRGFLRSLFSLGRAAASIGELDEAERVAKFLRESDPEAVAQLEK